MSKAMDAAALAEALRQAIPEDALSLAPEANYAVDGMVPALVVCPGSAEEVAAALAAANETGAAVLPRGGGTQSALGMPPERYDVALHLRRLDRLVEYEPADLTVTVEAGMRLSELQRLLGERGQWLPLDPPLAHEATIGGILATNASGPARQRYGTARDLLIGIRVATPEGQLVKAGGRVVKNVAGYDLGKLHIGALGTLGVIVQAAFKVAPLPEQVQTLRAEGSLAQMSELARSIVEARLPLLGAVLSKPPGLEAWTLAARFAAGASGVARSQREFESLARGMRKREEARPDSGWEELESFSHASTVAKASVQPSRGVGLAQAFADRGASVVAYPLAGIFYGAWSAGAGAEDVVALRRLAVETGGALVLERAPPELKRDAGVWGEPRGDFALMQSLKREFDSKGTLNPGRYLGGI